MNKRDFIKQTALAGAGLFALPTLTQSVLGVPTTNKANTEFPYGVAWYPEQWPESRWNKDLTLMKSLGFNIVRIAEFAWSTLEPSEGKFNFDWLAKAIDLALKNGINSIIGTPTASPPAWLSFNYPEIIRVEEGGSRPRHGARGHYSPASPKYLAFCKTIASELSKKFGQHPGVIGWQIDNEYWPFSFDNTSNALFQEWLKNRFKTLDALNKAWGNAYWSEDFQDWNQIQLAISNQNPCLQLAVKEFKSHVIRLYQQNQINAIRPNINHAQWITTNLHGEFQHCDGTEISKDLDFASFDPYVGTGHLNPTSMGFKLDRVRGFKKKPFWIMETQPGHVNWSWVNNELNPNETRRMLWHQVAHGADAVLFWQWRSSIGGQEQYHGALLGQSGELKPITAEIKQVGLEFQKVGKQLIGSKANAKVAMLVKNPDQWAIPEQKFHHEFDVVNYWRDWYEAIKMFGVDIDVISVADNLSAYSVIVAPARYIMTQQEADMLIATAKNGATVIFGARSARKDVNNSLIDGWQPGYGLDLALGAHIEEFYALEKEIDLQGELSGKCKIMAEWITPTQKETEVFSTYDGHPWLKGKAAGVKRKTGKGILAYIGCWPEKLDLSKIIGQFLVERKVIAVNKALPVGIEKCSRTLGKAVYEIYINHSVNAAKITVEKGNELLSGKYVSGEIIIQPDEVLVIFGS